MHAITATLARLDTPAFDLYLNADSNITLRSDEFTPTELRAIADDMELKAAMPTTAGRFSCPVPSTNPGAPILFRPTRRQSKLP